jgi:hypothetical protein
MAQYRLWRAQDDSTAQCDARDDEHAVETFSHQLGVKLTLAERPSVAGYMMAPIPPGVHWAEPPSIPVWEVALEA